MTVMLVVVLCVANLQLSNSPGIRKVLAKSSDSDSSPISLCRLVLLIAYRHSLLAVVMTKGSCDWLSLRSCAYSSDRMLCSEGDDGPDKTPEASTMPVRPGSLGYVRIR